MAAPVDKTVAERRSELRPTEPSGCGWTADLRENTGVAASPMLTVARDADRPGRLSGNTPIQPDQPTTDVEAAAKAEPNTGVP